jgi:hypothetical protein
MEGTGSHDNSGTVSLDEYMRLQREEICSEKNRWYAGERVGHDPTELEMAMHWLLCGAAAKFRECFNRPPAPSWVTREEGENSSAPAQ